jgi:hypothetical protein
MKRMLSTPATFPTRLTPRIQQAYQSGFQLALVVQLPLMSLNLSLRSMRPPHVLPTLLVSWTKVVEEGVAVGGLRLLKVLKNTTNMFSKYNTFTGTFDLGMKLYMI